MSSCSAKRAVDGKLPDSDTPYVSWGIDEYELFGLTKEELDSKYKGKMKFAPNFSKAILSDAKNECKSFIGPTFRLTYNDEGKVVAVQRCFEACGKDFVGPQLDTKKEALEFTVNGLAGTKNAKDLEKLASAKNELAKLK
ncbi:MAG: hypothetical protein IPG59_06510 [Candidatus Melainabacteria bacterium]|nr:MAG: hypothetical protein IPG59_06510 [Candidatus Melainabacteria bacterium]